MAFTYVKTCKVCKLIRRQAAQGESDLQKRINNSTQYDMGGESLRSIYLGYGGETDKQKFGYLSLLNHAKAHQAPTSEELADNRIAKLSDQLETEKLRKKFTHHEVRGMMRDLGGQQLEDGKIKLSGSVLATILKQEMEIEEKQKDREFEVFKMINAFQAGALLRESTDGPVTAERITS